MKKSIIIISFLVLFLTMSATSAFLFWPDNHECEQFSMGPIDGFSTPVSDELPYSISLVSSRDEEPKIFKISEVAPSSHMPNEIEETENYTDGDLTVMKGYVPGTGNCTCAEFDKDGRHFLVKIWYMNSKNHIHFDKDVDLIKKVKDSLQPKPVEKIQYEENFFDLKVKINFY